MKPAVICLAIGLLCCLSPAVLAGRKVTRRLEDLRTARDDDGVVTLVDGNFTAFTMEGPRPYAVLVYFTARDEKYHCFHCGPGEDEFRLLAKSYQHKPETDPPLFFAVADFPENYGAFRAFDFKMAPVVVIRPPEKRRRPTANPEEFKDESTQYGIFKPEHSAEDLTTFIADQVGVSVAIYRPPETMVWAGTIAAVGVALLAAFLAANPSWLAFFMKKPFWGVLCVAVYFFSVGGMVMCIIRQPQWYSRSRDGRNKFQFFNPRSGEQYIVEGLIMGTLNMICAGGVILLVHFSKRGRSTFFYVVLAAVCIAMFTMGFTTIFGQYALKNRWYTLQKVVPVGAQQLLRKYLNIKL